jgi:hypothetical protein
VVADHVASLEAHWAGLTLEVAAERAVLACLTSECLSEAARRTDMRLSDTASRTDTQAWIRIGER